MRPSVTRARWTARAMTSQQIVVGWAARLVASKAPEGRVAEEMEAAGIAVAVKVADTEVAERVAT